MFKTLSEANPIESEFASQPLAAASIAQVYRARLKTGEQVVVKVQRPAIREPVERDLDILLNMARTLEDRAGWARDFGVVELAEGFAEALREELDFRVEARNTATVAASLDAQHAGGQQAPVRIPRVFSPLSSSRVLVLEWLDLHRAELRQNWALARERRPLVSVPPLE